MIHNLPMESFFDPECDNSIYNLCKSRMLIKAIEKGRKWSLDHTDSELDDWYKNDTHPHQAKRFHYYRLAFWQEIDYAVSNKKHVLVDRLCAGIAHYVTFTKDIENPKIMAYVLQRPVSDQIKYKYLIDLGYEGLEEVLRLPIKDFKGRPDVKIMKEKRETLKMIQDRLEGAPIQRQHETRLVTNAPSEQIARNPADIEKELRRLLELKDPNSKIIKNAETKEETIEIEYRPVGVSKDDTTGETEAP